MVMDLNDIQETCKSTLGILEIFKSKKGRYSQIILGLVVTTTVGTSVVPREMLPENLKKVMPFLQQKSILLKMEAAIYPDIKERSAKYTICLDNKSDDNLDNLKVYGKISGKNIKLDCRETIEMDFKNEDLKRGKVLLTVKCLPKTSSATIFVESKSKSDILEPFYLIYNNEKTPLKTRDLSTKVSNFTENFNKTASRNIESNTKGIGTITP
jgi:hypothetical protein